MLLRGAKGILLASSLVVWFLGRRPNAVKLPRGLFGTAGFTCLAVLSIPGVYQATRFSLVIEFLVDIALSALFLWLLFSMQMSGHDTFRVFVRGMAVISAFAALPVVSALTGIPRFQSPFDLAPFTSTGFGAGRTGWANSLSLYVPIALAVTLSDKHRARAIAALMLIVVAQFVSGGRTGLLLSLFSTAGFVVVCGSKRLRALVLTIVLMGTIFVAGSATLRSFATDAVTDQLRLGNLRGRVTFELLDLVTSHRLRGYVTAIELIPKRPFLGHGLGSVRIYVPFLSREVEIHNVWLKYAVYCGVLFPLLLLYMVVTAVIVAIRTARGCDDRRGQVIVTAYAFVLVSGIGITMVEPAALVGAFQNSALWWGVAGSVLGHRIMSSQSSRPRVRQRAPARTEAPA